jgi:predicted DNA-binding transcriptional regulator AlpA
MPNRKFVRGHLLPDERVYSSLGVSRSTFYRLIEKGVISVPPGRIGKNRRGWTLADIELARQEIVAVKERV